MKKARLIITMDCPRKCPGCCNEYPSMKALMQPVRLDQLAEYDEVMITGGEPMLYPERIKTVVAALRSQRKERSIFMYSALYRAEFWELLPLLDGVHYTIHENPSIADIHGFDYFQMGIRNNPHGSYRLYIDQRVSLPVIIQPNLWCRVEIKPWLDERDCPLPEGESLLVLQDDAPRTPNPQPQRTGGMR